MKQCWDALKVVRQCKPVASCAASSLINFSNSYAFSSSSYFALKCQLSIGVKFVTLDSIDNDKDLKININKCIKARARASRYAEINACSSSSIWRTSKFAIQGCNRYQTHPPALSTAYRSIICGPMSIVPRDISSNAARPSWRRGPKTHEKSVSLCVRQIIN